MKNVHRSGSEIADTREELVGILAVLQGCVGRLQKLLHTKKGGGHGSMAVRFLSAARKGRGLDRYGWGRAVVASLTPKFDSHEFARAFRAPLPPEIAGEFDAVRLKKILLRLGRENVILMTAGGGGRRPAQYEVSTKPSDKPVN